MKVTLNRKAAFRAVDVLAMATLILPTFLLGDVIPGRWTLIEQLETGSEITVQLNSGDRIEGRFLGGERAQS